MKISWDYMKVLLVVLRDKLLGIMIVTLSIGIFFGACVLLGKITTEFQGMLIVILVSIWFLGYCAGEALVKYDSEQRRQDIEDTRE